MKRALAQCPLHLRKAWGFKLIRRKAKLRMKTLVMLINVNSSYFGLNAGINA
jgi:hypothetical protein